MISAYDLKELQLSVKELQETASLLSTVFGFDHFSTDFLNWQYCNNPDGKAVGYNAYNGSGELVAHYVTQPLLAMVNGREARGILSLNTATSEDHRGQGLFVRLANATYKRAAELGYEFVIGVANQNSTHGFVNKLGFQLVDQLTAKVILGNVELSSESENLSYYRIWNDENRKWRYSNPVHNYIPYAGHWLADTGKLGIQAVLGRGDGKGNGKVSNQKLFLGIDANANFRGIAIDVPISLRPSPLNLIYKDLTGNCGLLKADQLRFWSMDFDAY